MGRNLAFVNPNSVRRLDLYKLCGSEVGELRHVPAGKRTEVASGGQIVADRSMQRTPRGMAPFGATFPFPLAPAEVG
jgi:hypothetical protein